MKTALIVGWESQPLGLHSKYIMIRREKKVRKDFGEYYINTRGITSML